MVSDSLFEGSLVAAQMQKNGVAETLVTGTLDWGAYILLADIAPARLQDRHLGAYFFAS